MRTSIDTLQREGQGSITYGEPPGNSAGGGGAIAFTGANNGVSLSTVTPGTVVLGNDVGLNTAQLLSSREIPLNSFQLVYRDIGTVPTSFIIYRGSLGRALNTPMAQWQNSAGAELLTLRVYDNSSFYLGAGAGANSFNTGARTVVIGDGAFATAVGGTFESTIVGFQAMGGATGGVAHFATAIGCFALLDLTTGTGDTALGAGALAACTTGMSNTALGANASGVNITGTFNTAVGNGALGETLIASTNASFNTAVGAGCMQQQNYGNLNVAMGYQNLFNLTVGANNVSIGAGSFNTGGTFGSSNVCIGGSFSMLAAGSIGNANIIIGANFITTVNALTNLTVIGQGITCNISNVAVFGRADQNNIYNQTTGIVDNGSTNQFNGSVSWPLRSTAIATTLTAADVNLILTVGGIVITLPAAAAAKNRWYLVVNQTALPASFNINYIDFTGLASNVIPANAGHKIQSDGVNWNRII